MNIFEAILRANEEYTPAIQQLRDYIESQNNEVVYQWANHKVYFNLDTTEWDYVLTLNTVDSSLDFSQFDEDAPITIELHSRVKSNKLVTTTDAKDPQKIIDAAFSLVKKHALMLNTPKTDDDESVDIYDLIQCVIKVEDIGNDYSYEGIIEDNTDYEDQYEVDINFQDRLEDEPETINYVLAYHDDGKEKFYDENGEPLDLNMDKNDNFEKDYQAKIKDRNNTVPADKNEL